MDSTTGLVSAEGAVELPGEDSDAVQASSSDPVDVAAVNSAHHDQTAAVATAVAAAPFASSSSAQQPHARVDAQKTKSKKDSKVTTADGTTAEHVQPDTTDNTNINEGANSSNNNSAQSRSASLPPETKKSKKRSTKNKSPIAEQGLDTPATDAVEAAADASPVADEGNDQQVPRARGFTAVNSVLPVASTKPLQSDAAMEQLLTETAAAAAAAADAAAAVATAAISSVEKDADGDAPMDSGAAPTTGKKHKRKRKEKTAAVPEEQDEPEEPTAPQSSKKRKGKNTAAAAPTAIAQSPETQVPATQEPEEAPPTTIESAPEAPTADESGSRNKLAEHLDGHAEPAGNVPAHDPEVQSVPEPQPEPSSGYQDSPRAPTPPATTNNAISNPAAESSPVVTHTPKPKSKVAIAYERKRKRLEAAAAAAAAATAGSSPGYTYTIAEVGDGMDLDVPNEEDEEVISTPIREAPKSNKRRKRRMPDLNTPSRHAVHGHGSPRDDEEGEDGAEGEEGAFAPGSSQTPRPRTSSSARKARTPKTPRRSSNLPAVPQPGTTAVSRKRASYTYAPDPTPATPPSTGTFTQPECEIIDNYLRTFAVHNALTEKELIARIWGDTSVVPTQTKAEREAFWKELYELFPHRKRLAIYNHVRRRYHNFDVQGAKWDEAQDAALAKMVDELGKKWTNIGRAMGRLPDDCRDRWRNYVKCGEGRREKEWTDEEEAKLREVVAEVREALRTAAEGRGETLGADVEPNWTVVSEKMGGWRSRIQCRYKWSKMLEWEGKARLPDEEGGEPSQTPARKMKTPRKRAPRKSTATAALEPVASQPAEDEVPIDPALADATIPTAPETTNLPEQTTTTSAAKKSRAKKTKASKSQAAEATSSTNPGATGGEDESDNTITLASHQMLTGDRIWLLQSILAHQPETPSAIPWEQLAADSPHKHWTARGLERAFGKIVKKGISRRERDGLGVVEGVERLLRELEELPGSVRAERWVAPVENEGELLEQDEEVGGAAGGSGKGKGKATSGKSKRGRKPKNANAVAAQAVAAAAAAVAVAAAVTTEEEGGEEAAEGVEGVGARGDEELRDAVRMAMEDIKEREETEKLARVLLSSVQEAYGTQ